MDENEEKKEKSFKVSDRRIPLDDEETAKEDEAKSTSEPKIKQEAPKEKKSLKDKIFGSNKSEDATAPKTEPEKKEDYPLPGINFVTFILSMSGSAMFHMGQAPNPESGKSERNLPLAKQSINIIEMLKEKTKGNLTTDESKLLESVLYDLRMNYVQASKT